MEYVDTDVVALLTELLLARLSHGRDKDSFVIVKLSFGSCRSPWLNPETVESFLAVLLPQSTSSSRSLSLSTSHALQIFSASSQADMSHAKGGER